MATSNWTGSGADAKASTAGNWDAALAAGRDAIIATGSKACSFDVADLLASLSIATGYTGVVTQPANDINLGAGGLSINAAGATFTGDSSRKVSIAGPFSHLAGTVTNDVLTVEMTLDGSLFECAGSIRFKRLNALADITVKRASNYIMVNGLTVAAGKVLTIDPTSGLYYLTYNGGSLLNQGRIAGAGLFELTLYSSSPTVSLGRIDAPVRVRLDISSTASRILTLANDAVLGNTLNVQSDNGTYTATLDTNNKSLRARGITIGTRGMLDRRGGLLIDDADWDSSAGALDDASAGSQVIMTKPGATIKLGAGQKFYDLVCEGPVKLLSDITVDNIFAHAGEVDLNGFTITKTRPDLEYSGLRLPLVKKLVKRTIANPAARVLLEDIERIA